MDAQCDDPVTIDGRVRRLEALMFGRDQWVPIGRAAAMLGVSRHTIHSWIRRGVPIDARQFRGRWEISPAWIAAQLIPHRTEDGPDAA